MTESAEVIAGRLFDDMLATARAEVALVTATDPEFGDEPITDDERGALECGIGAGIIAALRVLVREGILPSQRDADR